MVCPAGYMDSERAMACIETLHEWGFDVKVGRTLGGGSENYFSGTDEERLEDLQLMLDNPHVKAILCGRGGYGLSRIIDNIDFSYFERHPKWIIGFSDVTVLHAHISTHFKTATLHGPMAGAFNDGGAGNIYVQSLLSALTGHRTEIHCEGDLLNRKGEAVGELVGGNLSILAHLCGTSSELKTRGKILFLEDVGEYAYNVDRMMYQLKRSGRLDKLAGLIVGGFTDMKDTTRPFGSTVYEIIHEAVKEYDYPAAFGFPVGHGKENYALKCGMGYKLKVTKKKVTLEE